MPTRISAMNKAPIRVLLVEDNPLHAHLLQAFLGQIEEQSFPVRRASDLNEGLEMVREEHFDVVLLDLVLPESRGLATFFRWRAKAPSLPVVVLTGLEDLDLATQAVESGAQDYLLKNQINAALLSRSLRYAVDRARARRREWDSPLYRLISQQLMKAATTVALEELVHQRLLYPARAQIFACPLERTGEMIFSYWGQHRGWPGPLISGLRIHPSVSLGEIAALSLRGSLRGALFGLAYQGGMGGISVAPQEIREEELRGLLKGYISQISADIRPEQTLFIAEQGVDQEAFGWAAEAFEACGYEPGALLFGGPPSGEPGRGIENAREKGLILLLELLAEKIGLSLRGASVIIQGGAQSLELAEFLRGAGAKVVGVGSAMGALVDEEGLDLEAMKSYRAVHGHLRGCPAGRPLEGAKLYGMRSDIFIAALPDQQIQAEQAQEMNQRIIVESSGGIISTAADEVFLERGVYVLPDLLADSGAEIGAYVKWEARQGREERRPEELEEQFVALMTKAFERTWQGAQSFGGELRTGALWQALQELYEALSRESCGGDKA